MKRVLNLKDAASSDSGVKRRKASQACASCRRHKTRCEILDNFTEAGTLQCHRCKVLGMECSFESSTVIHVASSAGTAASNSTIVVGQQQQLPSPPQSIPSASDSPPNGGHRSPAMSVPPIHLKLPQFPEKPRRLIATPKDLRPEDLVPGRNVPLGSNVQPGSFDWTAAPILSVQELISQHPSPSMTPSADPQVGTDQTLTDILTQDQITRLLDIFDIRYRPWLYHPPRSHENCPIMDLVSCLVAARHLDPMTQAKVSPRLYKLTERIFLSKIFNPTPSVESIQALVILSLWTPMEDSHNCEVRDNRLLAASAVSMAMNLQLSSAVQNMDSMGKWTGEQENAGKLSEAVLKARLWILLTTTESVLCLGTGRKPVSQRTDLDRKLIDFPCLSSTERARNVRLNYTTNLLDVVETGLRCQLESLEKFAEFYDRIWDLLAKMDCIYAPMNPLHIVSDHDKFYFHLLLTQYWGWKLLVLQHAIRELRTSFEGTTNASSWILFEYQGRNIGMIWCRDSVHAAQSVLTSLLHEQDIILLAAAPDYIFTLITYAAISLITANFSMYHTRGVHLGGACERLISMTVEKLSQIAHSPEHVPAKCAHLLAAMMGLWERRGPWVNEDGQAGPGCLSRMLTQGGEKFARGGGSGTNVLGHFTPPPLFGSGQAQEPSRSPPVATNGECAVGGDNIVDTAGGMINSWDQDIFNDPDFWTTFMTSLADPDAYLPLTRTIM